MTDNEYELLMALKFTADYVGRDILPAIPGWSWYDAIKKYSPELAAIYDREQNEM